MRALFRRLHHRAAQRHAVARGRTPFISSWLLHKLYPGRADVAPRHGTISEGVTLAQFDELLRFHRRRGHVFLAPDQLGGPLDPRAHHVLITFDDGYANNRAAVDLLQRHGAVATFHISTDHVRHGMAYWWDVLYRERTARGTPHAEAMAEVRAWKRWRWEEQERRLADLFGPRALEPAGELDRPLTVDELKAMAASPHVRIGDHTHRHLALPLYTDEEVRDSLRASVHWLQRTIGVAPVSFAYPYGSLDDRAVRLALEAGHRVGLAYAKGPVGRDDLHADGLMRVRRNTLTGSLDITTQCHNLFVGAAPAR